MKLCPAFLRNVASGMLLTMLAAAPAFAVDVCIDIESSPNALRILRLVATPVGDSYFSLVGVHTPQSDSNVDGSVTGAAAFVNDKIIMNVQASSVVNSTMEATSYQFNFDAAQTPIMGTFHGIIQQSVNGTTTPPLNKSGQAALVVDCVLPITSFTGTQPPPPSTNENPGCFDDDLDFVRCFAAGGNDCNDKDASISPLKAEICGDGIDQNCDGIDPPCSTDNDSDNDGFDSLASGGQDCDDNNFAVKPGVAEVCSNNIDDNCNGTVNEGCDDVVDNDIDNDGYVSLAAGGTDCNDNNPAIKPGAVEICGNGIDEDCSGADLACVSSGCIDFDRDGYNRAGGTNCGPVDCDDATPYINPGMTEVCGNRVDENCQATDNNCTTYPEYTNVTTDTMTQVGTNLVWQRGHYDTYTNPALVWTRAVDYCNNLVLGGASDWRLPTVQELRGIVDLHQQGTKIDPRFTSSPTGYWSATANVNNSDFAYGVDFNDGSVKSILKTMLTFDALVRCVRP